MDWSKNKYEVRDYFFQLKTDCQHIWFLSMFVLLKADIDLFLILKS